MEHRKDVPLYHDEILVRMLLSPINPSELIPIRGAYKHRIKLPAIPGYEGVGIVEKIGASIPTSLMGKRVLPLRGEGTWQQYVKTKANFAIHVPDGIDDETASQMYINPITAWTVCTEELRLSSDDILIVNACGSAIGRIFAQLSRVFGYRLIAVVRNNIHTQELQSYGAWAVIDTSRVNLIDTVMDLTNGLGATAGIESIGGTDGHELIKCIRRGGTVLSIGLLSGIQMNWAQIKWNHANITVKPYWLRKWIEEVAEVRWHETFDDVFDLVTNMKLTVQTVRKRYGLWEYEKAIIEAGQSGYKGKVLFTPQTLFS